MSKQDDKVDIRGLQTDGALSYGKRAQGPGELRSKNNLLQGQGEKQTVISTDPRAIRTKTILASSTICKKKIAYGPHNPSQQCVACRRKVLQHSVVHQQAPASTAVMVAPTAVTVPPGFVPTAVMVAPTAPIIIPAAAIEKNQPWDHGP